MKNLFYLPNKTGLSVQHSTLAITLLRKRFVRVRFLENSVHFLSIMAFVTNVDEFQALLDGCSSTHDWELLLESILIPDEWIPVAYARLSELTAQEIPVSILFRLWVLSWWRFTFLLWNNEYSLIFTKPSTSQIEINQAKGDDEINEADELDNFVCNLFCLKCTSVLSLNRKLIFILSRLL